MKTLFAAATAAAILAATGFAAQAESANVGVNATSSAKPGASIATPGHKMQTEGSVKGTTGASGYAPGHTTTGAAVKDDATLKSGEHGASIGVNSGIKANTK